MASSSMRLVASRHTDEERPRRRRRWPRRLGLVAGGVLCFIAGAITALIAVGLARHLLVVETYRVYPAQAIVVMGGGGGEREAKAAALYREGLAPVVIMSSGCAEGLDRLLAAGVPPEAVVLECSSKSTRENAYYSASILNERGARRAIVVTSWYHSRRALASFAQFAPRIQFVSAPSQEGRGFHSGVADELKFVTVEYAKVAYYGVRWGIWPWHAGVALRGKPV